MKAQMLKINVRCNPLLMVKFSPCCHDSEVPRMHKSGLVCPCKNFVCAFYFPLSHLRSVLVRGTNTHFIMENRKGLEE